MEVIAIIAALYILVLATDFRAAVRRGRKAEICAYALCLIVSFVILVRRAMGVPLWGPNDLIIFVMQALLPH